MSDRQVKCGSCQQMVSWCGVDGYGRCRECATKETNAHRAQSGLTSDFGPAADAAIDAAIAQFPTMFKLRGHEGTFRIGRRESYVSQGRIMLYTQRLRTTQVQNGPSRGQYQDEWCDFAKGTVEELKAQVVGGVR